MKYCHVKFFLASGLLAVATFNSIFCNPTFAASANPAMEFFDAEKKFDNHQYAEAERVLENIYAELRSRDQNEIPSNTDLDTKNLLLALTKGENIHQKVNVHNYSIMTIELLAKCKYARCEYGGLSALMREQRQLVQRGYTNKFAGTSVEGPMLYIAAFEAVAFLAAGDWKSADKDLAYCSNLQHLPDSRYSWLGDQGSPQFAKCLWLSTKQAVLAKQGKAAEAKKMEAQVKALRHQLGFAC